LIVAVPLPGSIVPVVLVSATLQVVLDAVPTVPWPVPDALVPAVK
jgi:hypothetical protein